jgi:predicted enzyme related to lactoylglutathione lyase
VSATCWFLARRGRRGDPRHRRPQHRHRLHGPDVDAAHAELAAKGVKFTMGPGKMPWGGYMAMFVDPDGNEFYLDQA